MIRTLCALVASTSLAFALVACSDDAVDQKETPASCETIVETCHPLDQGSGPIHECHEQAEAETATETSCAAIKEQCLKTCAPK